MKFKLLLTISVMMCTMCIASEDTAPLDEGFSSAPQASPDLPPDLEGFADLTPISDDVMRHQLLQFVDQETKKSIQNSSEILKRYVSQDKSHFDFTIIPDSDKTEKTMVKIFQAFPTLKVIDVDLKTLEAISNVMKQEEEYYEWETHSKTLKKDFPFRTIERIHTLDEDLTEKAVDQLEQFKNLKHLEVVLYHAMVLDRNVVLKLMNNIIPKLQAFHISFSFSANEFYPLHANQELEVVSYKKLLSNAKKIEELGITLSTPFHYDLTILEQFPNLKKLALTGEFYRFDHFLYTLSQNNREAFEKRTKVLMEKINWEPLLKLNQLKELKIADNALPDHVLEKIIKNNPNLEDVWDLDLKLNRAILERAGFKEQTVTHPIFLDDDLLWKRKVRRP